jgi:type I restriction enzyme S subunit
MEDVRTMELPELPPLPTQRRTGEILSAYDDLIENNTRRMRILERIAQMLYREWFVDFRFPGHEKVRMVESEWGHIPQGWIGRTVGDLCDDVRRSVNPSDLPAETPYIGLEHMPRKCVALSEWGQSGQVQSTKLRFNRGNILFGKIRPYFHKVGIAPVNGVCSSDAIVIVPKEAKYSSVVLLCVSSDDFVRQATQTSQGTKMPRANWGVLARYPIAVPGTHLLERFNETVDPMIQLLNNLVFRNRCLRKTRDLLLPKVVSGEVSVEQIEAEVPAQTV